MTIRAFALDRAAQAPQVVAAVDHAGRGQALTKKIDVLVSFIRLKTSLHRNIF